MPGDRIHPSSDSIQSGAKASFNPPPNPQYKPKFWNKSFPTTPSEMLPGSRQCLLTSLQQEAQLVNCMCAAGGGWMQGIDRWIPSIPPLHNHSAVNRRHFSTPEKLHADCDKEMLDGGVPGTTVREMVRTLDVERGGGGARSEGLHLGWSALRMPSKGTAWSTSRRGLCAPVGIAADGETFGVAEECPQTLEGICCILHSHVCLPRAIFSGSRKSRSWTRAESLARCSPGGFRRPRCRKRL
ncbi:uncharacterized protein LOC115835556 [Nomascus leucogenys]|uniref:uncharacterized protein LOC115835556 n=1 Tax=Nomascus leucogenys TaxID=61853 RepID=UPI00122DB327|nr:uncharacterized protein LOC115835556 [Nomascus leucogenys]